MFELEAVVPRQHRELHRVAEAVHLVVHLGGEVEPLGADAAMNRVVSAAAMPWKVAPAGNSNIQFVLVASALVTAERGRSPNPSSVATGRCTAPGRANVDRWRGESRWV